VKIFDGYAKLYDLFYQHKDYEAEISFIQKIINQHRETALKNILDLGCGTGGHALPLADLGYQITGVDISGRMIEQAQKKASESNLPVDFLLGDIRSIDLQKTFDAVISMFAVMGYQTSNDDFYAALRVARKHLTPGGLFVFDTWFGPAVLHERPETRVREIADGKERVIRIASPELDPLANIITVNYTILRLMESRVVDEIRESHPMRFFFAPEVAFFAQHADFKVETICPFLNADRIPDDRDWNVTWVLRAV